MNSTKARLARVRDWRLIPVQCLAATLVVLLLVGCADPTVTDDRPAVRIGAGTDSESLLIAEIMLVALAAVDIPATVTTLTGSGASRRALLEDRIDIRIVYTGEAWLDVLGRPDPPSGPRESFVAVREFDQNQPVTWLTPRFGTGFSEPPANATFALVIDPNGPLGPLDTMSQLASVLSVNPDAALCVDDEFRQRPDGLRALLAVYSVQSNQPVIAATPSEAVLAVAAGECVAGLTTTTDGAAWLVGLKPLRDDLGVFPAFVVAIQVRDDLIVRIPTLADVLAPLSRQLTTELLGQFNARLVAGDGLRGTAEAAYEALEARHNS